MYYGMVMLIGRVYHISKESGSELDDAEKRGVMTFFQWEG